MRRSALRDRNDESEGSIEAIARIKAIAAGKTSRSAFLDDSDAESSPSTRHPERAEKKENSTLEMSSDDDSPVQPVRRKKTRLVCKSELEKQTPEPESPSPAPKPRSRQRAVFNEDSDSESEDVAPMDADYAGDDDALVNAMSGLGVNGGATKVAAPTQAAPTQAVHFAPRPAPFAPVVPSTWPNTQTVNAPAPTATPPRPRPNVAKPVTKPVTKPASTPVRSAPSPGVHESFASPAGGPKPMRLKGREGGPRFELAGELAARLYDHQRDGVRWMWNLQLQGRGGILADDMGLGKTLQVAAFAAGLLRSRAAKRVLCLAPTTLLPHWGKEFQVAGLTEGVNLFKFVSTMSKSEKEKVLRLVTDRGGVLLSTYGMVTHNDTLLGAPESESDAEKVANASGRGAAVSQQDMPQSVDSNSLVWDWIVCDEGHKLKNPNAQLPIKLRTLPAYHRLIITGTPIQNQLNELWALYDLCSPGLLGCEGEFRKEFAKKIAVGQSRDATERQRSAGARASDELRRLCRPFMLRREKSAVLAKAAAEAQTEEQGDEEGSNVSNFFSKTPSKTPLKGNVPSNPGQNAPRTSIESSTTGWAGVRNVPSQLGTKNDLVVWIPLAAKQQKLYRAFLNSSTVRAVLNKTGSAIAAINVLKKICDHPSLCVAMTEAKGNVNDTVSSSIMSNENDSNAHDDEDEDDTTSNSESKREAVLSAIKNAGLTQADLDGSSEASGKAKFLRAMLTKLTENGHRTLVFSQSRKMLDVIEKFAKEDGHTLVRIDGNVPAEERHNRVERFQAHGSCIPLCLLTTQVGGLGLTLTAADRVVIYDPSWNPASDSQSVDRAYRIGQTRDVVVYRLISCGTVEEKVYRRQVFKSGLSRAGTQDGNHFRYFSAEDSQGLFEVSEKYGFDKSETQAEIEALHKHDRKWTFELTEIEAPLLKALGTSGVSDHDLLFSKEDTTKAGEGATTMKSSGFGGGKTSFGGGAAATAKATGKGKSGGWKGVDSGWGGDAQLGMLAAAAGSALAATPASFAITNAKAKNPVVASVVDKRGSLSPSSKSSSAPMDATKNKAMEKLLNLKSQKEKQELLLDMPGMLRKLPDKGKSISERIDALTVEIEAMEKEVKAKYDEGSVEPVSQDSKTPVVVKPVSDPSQHGNLSVLPTPTTVMMSPSPSSPSPYASTAERESIRETVSPDIEFVAETNKTQSEDSDSFVSANEEDLDDTVEILDTTAEAEELDTTIGVEQVDDLANMMGGMGV